jgi:hypothetical protein
MNRTLSEEPLSTADPASANRPDARPDSQRASSRERPESAPVEEGRGSGPLLPQGLVQELRSRWDAIQTGFVDEPRNAVQQADELVALAIKHLAQSFTDQRNQLERQWDRSGDVSTEDLRIGLQRYRAFFHRLLSM